MKTTLVLAFLLIPIIIFGQDPLRFEEEVAKFKNAASDYPEENRIVFTGSSSIRLWVDFKAYFPNHNVINTGFGGSETSDLIHYQDLLIKQFSPKQVFIYEGDNDTNSGKSSGRIMKDLKVLISSLKASGIEDIVLIAAKPSIARWQLKADYQKLNKKIEKLASKDEQLRYANVWDIMLDDAGNVREDIFIEDNLHMNKKGYDLWIKVIAPLLKSE